MRTYKVEQCALEGKADGDLLITMATGWWFEPDLKNTSQLGWLFQIDGKIKKIQTTNLAIVRRFFWNYHRDPESCFEQDWEFIMGIWLEDDDEAILY